VEVEGLSVWRKGIHDTQPCSEVSPCMAGFRRHTEANVDIDLSGNEQVIIGKFSIEEERI
jgi:hypothetical protein